MDQSTASDEFESADSGVVVRNISKTFTGTKALKDVSAHFPRGSITALLGQNGSGKSTLIKILAGFYVPDPGGSASVAGTPLSLPVSPATAHDAGLRFIHQDLGLVPTLTVADNYAFVNGFGARVAGPISAKKLNARVQASLDRFNVGVSPKTLVGDLTPTEQTMVAISRAFDENARVLILDEPTASLPADEVHLIVRILRQARDEGLAIIFVSHRIDEVRELADRLVVLRDGVMTADQPIEGLEVPDIITLILGRDFKRTRMFGKEPSDTVLLTADHLHGTRLQDVSLELRAGEILGVTGLVGCGRSELTRFLTGVQKPTSGTVAIEGKNIAGQPPAVAIKEGVALVPQDRRSQGCIPLLPLEENLSLSNLKPFWKTGWLRTSLERASAEEAIEEFDIRPDQPGKLMAQFSGGNQQKGVVAKWTRVDLKVLVLDEPTQGVDIGAKQEIAQIIRNLADSGVGVIVASSDFEEIVNLCDRVIVLNRGQISAEVDRDDLTESQLTLLSTAKETMSA